MRVKDIFETDETARLVIPKSKGSITFITCKSGEILFNKRIGEINDEPPIAVDYSWVQCSLNLGLFKAHDYDDKVEFEYMRPLSQ